MARSSKYGPFNYERILGTRNYSFTAQVSDFASGTVKRLNAVALQSTEDLINEVQTPVGKGGKMRVDTGFLRASGQVSLSGMPSGPTMGRKRTADEPPDTILYPTAPVAIAALEGFHLGLTIFFGWTANYAKYREAYDGFLISGIQNWQTIVDRVCAQIMARSPANQGTE